MPKIGTYAALCMDSPAPEKYCKTRDCLNVASETDPMHDGYCCECVREREDSERSTYRCPDRMCGAFDCRNCYP